MEEKKPLNNGVNTGLILEEPQQPDHILGGVNVAGLQITKPEPPVIFQDGHGWTDVCSSGTGELQANDKFESFFCTIAAVGGALSDYIKKRYGEDNDISECIQAVLAGVQPGVGGTARNSLESFRTLGWVEESYRKFTNATTQAECYAVVSNAIRKIAKGKLDKWVIYWDWVDTSSNVPHSKIIQALPKGEVVVAGYAWASFYGHEGVFNDYNYPANHLFRIGDGGNISQSVKDKFKGRGFDVDWSLVDLIAIDSYRFNWIKDKNLDHTSLNDFLKPLAKNFRIWSAHRVWCEKKNENNLLINFIKNMIKSITAWFDNHGLHLAYTPVDSKGNVIGKQVLDMSNVLVLVKALLKGMYDFKFFNNSDWASVSRIPDLSEDKIIR